MAAASSLTCLPQVQRSSDTPGAAWGLASAPLFLQLTTALPLYTLSPQDPFPKADPRTSPSSA